MALGNECGRGDTRSALAVAILSLPMAKGGGQVGGGCRIRADLLTYGLGVG